MTNLTKEQAIEWLRKNKDYIKPSVIGKDIGVDPGTMTRIITGTLDVRGYEVSLPDRSLPQLIEVINQIIEMPEVSK